MQRQDSKEVLDPQVQVAANTEGYTSKTHEQKKLNYSLLDNNKYMGFSLDEAELLSKEREDYIQQVKT